MFQPGRPVAVAAVPARHRPEYVYPPAPEGVNEAEPLDPIHYKIRLFAAAATLIAGCVIVKFLVQLC
jgi:hypothetical protein